MGDNSNFEKNHSTIQGNVQFFYILSEKTIKKNIFVF